MAKRNRKESERVRRERRRALAAVCGQTVRACVGGLPLACILAGVAWGAVRIWSAALEDPRFRIGGDTVSLRVSASLCEEAVAELERLGRRAAGRSLLDPGLLGELRRAYAGSPWVRSVCALRRVFPNRLAVEFVLRLPVAQVKQSGYYWMVDEEGLLLPVPGRREPVPGLPQVMGEIGRRPTEGRVWRDPGLNDALAVLELLRGSPLSDRLPVRRVLVQRGSFLDSLHRQKQARPRLTLETERGVTVRWGTFNRGELPDEVRSEEKIAMLRQLVASELARYPGVFLDVRTRVPGFSPPEDREERMQRVAEERLARPGREDRTP